MINEYAYNGDPDFGHTAQLIWYLEVQGRKKAAEEQIPLPLDVYRDYSCSR